MVWLQVIDFSHGVCIYESCPTAVDPLWVSERGRERGESRKSRVSEMKPHETRNETPHAERDEWAEWL